MSANPSTSDWAGARGEKWCARAAGMEATLAPIDEPLIQALRLETPCRIADVGCGAGGTAREIHRRAPAGSVVHGFDVSATLVRAANAGSSVRDRNLAFTRADVATAEAPEEPYGRLVSRFGIMFYDDPPAAFAHLRSWLASQGRFAFAVWAPQEENPWTGWMREELARLVDVPEPDRDAPGPFRYARAEKLQTLLEGAGFGPQRVRTWCGGLPIGGGLPAAQAASFLLASSSMAELLSKADAETAAEAHRLLAARFENRFGADAVYLGASVHIFSGSVP